MAFRAGPALTDAPFKQSRFMTLREEPAPAAGHMPSYSLEERVAHMAHEHSGRITLTPLSYRRDRPKRRRDDVVLNDGSHPQSQPVRPGEDDVGRLRRAACAVPEDGSARAARCWDRCRMALRAPEPAPQATGSAPSHRVFYMPLDALSSECRWDPVRHGAADRSSRSCGQRLPMPITRTTLPAAVRLPVQNLLRMLLSSVSVSPAW
ncbi:hypothetical protein PsYK624_115690 [Phanerochaete sordida]|uniref:Uncharacterized protein n=1 Tax=Phanerochaete sordida TaxID=48140 RepID=A0A9P3GKV3_9APHY|nr:hypothetical protein PsYK624_115690 [Phanerochaete sordida]